MTPATSAAYSASDMANLRAFYRKTLLEDSAPFWLKNSLDREHGGFITALDRDGAVLDTDKSVWFQGRCTWMFATMYNTVEKRPEWLEAARSGEAFMTKHGFAPDGKMYFTVTREGRPLRMRRYVYSESFAAIAYAALFKATGEARLAERAKAAFATYLRFSFTPGLIPAKAERPGKGLAPFMIAMVTAQEVRANLGDVTVEDATCTEWIDRSVAAIRKDFMKPELKAVMECVAPDGSIMDHFDGRILNPGHAIEAAWFILHEAKLRGDAGLKQTGLTILDWMWKWGWDEQFGGILYFRDVYGKPVQEYWQDMKFWWPHNEAVIATMLAFEMTGDAKYAQWHKLVHDWSFKHFADPEFGEWYGYLHRDGTPSVRLKGNMWKGFFHHPRMLWYCSRIGA